MTDYTELVKDLRNTVRVCRDRMDGQVMLDAADAIEALQKALQAEHKKTVAQIYYEEQMAWEGRCKDLMYWIADLQAHLPKRGEWELIDGAEPMRWGCSRCKYMSWETSNYCPRCGAKMEVQDG